jgi:hypothetical protein
MQKTTLVLGSVGAVLILVACAATPDEGSGASNAADTTATNATSTTGRTTARTGRTTGPAAPSRNGAVLAGVNASVDGGTAPASCYGGQGACDPTDPNACGKGETCDIDGSTGEFACFPPPNDAHLGDACDNSQGPFCSAGLACDQGTCKQYCCDDSICAAGTTCQEVGSAGFITIKVCQ